MTVRFDEIGPPFWYDKPVILVGGGPSLLGFDFSTLKTKNAWIVGVNQAMFEAPCHCGITADVRFFSERRPVIQSFAERFPIYVCMNEDLGNCKALHLQKRWMGELSETPTAINTVGSSGYAALNLAYLKRAKKIALLGYDYGLLEGKHHYHNRYAWHKPTHEFWNKWAPGYASALPQLKAAGVDVVNASPKSAITAFPKISLIEAMKGI